MAKRKAVFRCSLRSTQMRAQNQGSPCIKHVLHRRQGCTNPCQIRGQQGLFVQRHIEINPHQNPGPCQLQLLRRKNHGPGVKQFSGPNPQFGQNIRIRCRTSLPLSLYSQSPWSRPRQKCKNGCCPKYPPRQWGRFDILVFRT